MYFDVVKTLLFFYMGSTNLQTCKIFFNCSFRMLFFRTGAKFITILLSNLLPSFNLQKKLF